MTTTDNNNNNNNDENNNSNVNNKTNNNNNYDENNTYGDYDDKLARLQSKQKLFYWTIVSDLLEPGNPVPLKDGLMGRGEICERDMEDGGIGTWGLGPENML